MSCAHLLALNFHDLQALSHNVSLLIESVADDWEVFVIGKKIWKRAVSDIRVFSAHSIKSPWCEGLCLAKTKDTTKNLFPLNQVHIADSLTILKQTPKVPSSVVNAYSSLPLRAKIVTKLLLTVSEVWLGMLERVGELSRNRGTCLCFMVATLAMSSIW